MMITHYIQWLDDVPSRWQPFGHAPTTVDIDTGCKARGLWKPRELYPEFTIWAVEGGGGEKNSGPMGYHYPSPDEAFRMLAATAMRAFTPNDWSAFAGCSTKNPRIGTYGTTVMVLDGAVLQLLTEGDDGGGQLYKLEAK